MVAIATPLSLGADLRDGGYLGLMELRTEDAQAFAQLGPCGEIASACVASILGWSVGQPPSGEMPRASELADELRQKELA